MNNAAKNCGISQLTSFRVSSARFRYLDGLRRSAGFRLGSARKRGGFFSFSNTSGSAQGGRPQVIPKLCASARVDRVIHNTVAPQPLGAAARSAAGEEDRTLAVV